MGPHCADFAMPIPDTSHYISSLAGVGKRYAMDPPHGDDAVLKLFAIFNRVDFKLSFTPLCPDSDLSVETWLEDTSYPGWRKDQLWEVFQEWTDLDDPMKKYKQAKSHIKFEAYAEYKYPRPINSRDDGFKVFSGPMFKKIEKEVFANPDFVKYVPVRLRGQYLMEHVHVEGRDCKGTDYKSFEALFKFLIMRITEVELYFHMMSKHPFLVECERISKTLTGVNKCKFRAFTVWVIAKRLSGEMCTSLGNGVTNRQVQRFVSFMSFIEYKTGEKIPELSDPKIQMNGYVVMGLENEKFYDYCTRNIKYIGEFLRQAIEGDDGLFTNPGVPQDLYREDLFEKLGLLIKIERYKHVSDASFCGLLFDPEERTIVTDPREFVATLGWAPARYRLVRLPRLRALLKAKVLSYAYQYPGCPIIAPMACGLLYQLRNIAVEPILRGKHVDQWQLGQLKEAVDALKQGVNFYKTPGPNTRFLVHRLYGICEELQIKEEARIIDLNKPFRSEMVVHPDWITYQHMYQYHAVSENVQSWTELFDPGTTWKPIEKVLINSTIRHLAGWQE